MIMQHPGLRQKAYNIIKNKILNLEFIPGSRIREDLLATAISMSRTPVREAISQLIAEGLIRSVPRKGLFCIDLSRDEIKELLEIRESLEILSLKKCIEKVTDGQLKDLVVLIYKFEEALNRKDYEACNKLDSDFHVAIAKISKNNKLIEFILDIEEFMVLFRNLEKKTNAKERSLTGLRQHKVIYECIKNKDVEGAVKAVEDNIKSLKEHLKIQ